MNLFHYNLELYQRGVSRITTPVTKKRLKRVFRQWKFLSQTITNTDKIIGNIYIIVKTDVIIDKNEWFVLFF